MFSFQDSRGFLTRWFSGFKILLIPPGKVSKSFADPDGGAEAVVFFETGAVGIGDRDVAGLHADQFAVSVKVVVPGEDGRVMSPDEVWELMKAWYPESTKDGLTVTMKGTE